MIYATDANLSEIEIQYNRVDNYSFLTKTQHTHACMLIDMYNSLFARDPT